MTLFLSPRAVGVLSLCCIVILIIIFSSQSIQLSDRKNSILLENQSETNNWRLISSNVIDKKQASIALKSLNTDHKSLFGVGDTVMFKLVTNPQPNYIITVQADYHNPYLIDHSIALSFKQVFEYSNIGTDAVGHDYSAKNSRTISFHHQHFSHYFCKSRQDEYHREFEDDESTEDYSSFDDYDEDEETIQQDGYPDDMRCVVPTPIEWSWSKWQDDSDIAGVHVVHTSTYDGALAFASFFTPTPRSNNRFASSFSKLNFGLIEFPYLGNGKSLCIELELKSDLQLELDTSRPDRVSIFSKSDSNVQPIFYWHLPPTIPTSFSSLIPIESPNSSYHYYSLYLSLFPIEKFQINWECFLGFQPSIDV